MKLLVLSFVAFSILLGGCTVVAETPKTDPPKVSTKEAVYPDGTVFVKTDDSKDVPLAVGSTIQIKLQEDPKGKFIWGILENNKSIFEVVSNVSALENTPGSKGVKTRTFTMKGTKPGKSNLKIVYFMAGDEDNAGADYVDSYKLNITLIKQ